MKNLCHLDAQSLAELVNIYLFDILTILYSFMGEKKLQACFNLVQVLKQTCQELMCFPINHNITQSHCTMLAFLAIGLGIGTIDNTLFIIDDKSSELQNKLAYALSANNVTLRNAVFCRFSYNKYRNNFYCANYLPLNVHMNLSI